MKKIYTIGREEGCDIILQDDTNVISRLHATLRIDSKGNMFLTDQSKNGTYVNGMKMSSNVEIPVSRKDSVSFANVCSLDWNLIPNVAKKRNIITASSISLFCVLLFAIIYFINTRPTEKVTKETKPQVKKEVRTETKTDTVVVRDTITVKTVEPKPVKKQKEKKDSVKSEKPSEVIYNPIY